MFNEEREFESWRTCITIFLLKFYIFTSASLFQVNTFLYREISNPTPPIFPRGFLPTCYIWQYFLKIQIIFYRKCIDLKFKVKWKRNMNFWNIFFFWVAEKRLFFRLAIFGRRFYYGKQFSWRKGNFLLEIDVFVKNNYFLKSSFFKRSFL